MHIITIPCLKDNYAYLVHTANSRRAVVVDPSEGPPVLLALRDHGLELEAVLCTHHHADHTGGIVALRERYPAIKVFGYHTDRGRIPEQTEFLNDGEELTIAGLTFEVIHIPGHTLGAIAYAGSGNVFTGDTLFIAGCGRLFEGSAAQMYASLNIHLGRLPDHTRVYCGHEYTLANLRFAAHVDPQNAAVKEQTERAQKLREKDQPTVPSTLGEERAINPFLRCHDPAIQQMISHQLGSTPTPEVIFGALRTAKDSFK